MFYTATILAFSEVTLNSSSMNKDRLGAAGEH